MNAKFREAKNTVRAYMRDYYSIENLLTLIDAARADVFAFFSCCCLIGLPTADHEVKGASYADGAWWSCVAHYRVLGTDREAQLRIETNSPHYLAEVACKELMPKGKLIYANPEGDAHFRRMMLPIAKAELRRRQPKITTPEVEVKALATV